MHVLIPMEDVKNFVWHYQMAKFVHVEMDTSYTMKHIVFVSHMQSGTLSATEIHL